ncbi:MAG: ABC transporter permease [Planctomycetota bacterium]|nr:ABC transporter permease [Planctomycetota bacterium]
MTDAPNSPETAAAPEHVADDYVSFWDIARRQYAKNRPAMIALICLLTLIVLATFAPLIALNLPYVVSTADGVEFPLFRHLFDRLIFQSGVDVFFNLLLVLAPVFWLGGRVVRILLPAAGESPTRKQLYWYGGPLALILVFQLVLAGAEMGADVPEGGTTFTKGLFRFLLPLGLTGIGFLWYRRHKTRLLQTRTRRRLAVQTRGAMGLYFAAIFFVTITWFSYTLPIELWRSKIVAIEKEGGWAMSPPVFYHPDNIGEDSNLPGELALKPPDFGARRNFLGTDLNGRDVFARLVYGTRISLTIGIIAVSIYATIGIFLGSLAGFFGGWVDNLIISLLQIMICIPGMFLLLTIVSVFETRSIFMIMIAIGVTSWPGITRLIRGEFFRQRAQDYVTAARALGIPQRKIIFGHILKNSMGPVLVAAAFGVASAILSESFLAFIGLGDEKAPSWGQVLKDGRDHGKLWLIWSPGFAIFFVVTVMNLIGDGIRDALDPKMRR